MSELDRIRNKKNKKPININYSNYLIKVFVTIILFLLTIIVLKNNDYLKKGFYNYIYEDNISFAMINKTYKKYFGNIFPLKEMETEKVFSEKLVYSNKSQYKEGLKLEVENNYLVSNQENGLVIFIGNKEGYGNTLIVQQTDGVDVWYGNLKEINVNLYDYVEKGNLLGMTEDNKLYLVYKKDGAVLDYNDKF
ncbi:MAG: M23 family metallopeptidase [Bacilli bacterium]|nr:M23 family metallopeptidase [Bacilli bacterium]MDD4733811.1 M23 family metallopeptidase [Bacilli bacterium]